MEDRDIIALYFARNEDAIKESSVKYGGYVTGISMSIVNEYDYDESGNLVRTTFTSDEDNIITVNLYEYNEHGEKTKELLYTYVDSELASFSTVVYEYGIIS